MDRLPLTSLATLLSLAVYFWTLFLVGKGRTKFGIAAPSVSGNEFFERRFRVQMNTIEQLFLFLPALWLCGFWVGDMAAAAGGVVWSLGRVIYGLAYISEPKKRGLGFALTIAPSFVMAIAAAVEIIRSLLGS